MLVVRLDAIDPGILIYDASDGNLHSNLGKTKWAEIQAWIGKDELDPPSWLADQIKTELELHRETIRLAASYRASMGDLFGQVVDPDDVADGRI